MADKRCKNGHFIDESWDICPYCPPESSVPEIPVVRPSRLEEAAPRAAAVPRSTAAPSISAAPAPVSRPDSVPPPLPFEVPERTVAARKLDPAGSPVETKRYVVGWLVGLNKTKRGESYAVRMGRNVLGRDRRSDIAVEDEQVSAHHADLVFRTDERRYILMDANSTNGTYVNEEEIEPRRDLVSGDVIRIGVHRFLFVPLCMDGTMWDSEGDLK